jgi:hypothetical protein
LALLRQAAAKPALQLSTNDPFRVPRSKDDLSFDFQLQIVTQPLGLEARARAASGQTAAAIDDVSALLGVARQAYAEIELPAGTYHATVIEQMGLNALEDVLRLSRPRPADLTRVSLDGDYPNKKQIVRRQVGFAAMGLVLFSPDAASLYYWEIARHARLRMGTPNPTKPESKPEGYSAPAWFEASVMPVGRVIFVPDALDSVHRLLRDSSDMLQSKDPLEPFEHWLKDENKIEQEANSVFYRLIKQPFYNNLRDIRDAVTRRRLARIAVAMISYKDKNGRYADNLQDLVPAFLDRLPVDPWNESEFHWRHNEKDKQWILYSDRNGTDEPNLARDDVEHRRDVVFRLPE